VFCWRVHLRFYQDIPGGCRLPVCQETTAHRQNRPARLCLGWRTKERELSQAGAQWRSRQSLIFDIKQNSPDQIRISKRPIRTACCSAWRRDPRDSKTAATRHLTEARPAVKKSDALTPMASKARLTSACETIPRFRRTSFPRTNTRMRSGGTFIWRIGSVCYLEVQRLSAYALRCATGSRLPQ
jgi:hypothetical protein